jgi:hypothetical protein
MKKKNLTFKKRIFKYIKNFYSFILNKKFLFKIFKILILVSLIVSLSFFFNCSLVRAMDDDFSSLFSRDIRSPWLKTLTDEEIDFAFMVVNLFKEKLPNNIILQAISFSKTFLQVFIKAFDKNY